MQTHINFNQPRCVGREAELVEQVLRGTNTSGDGPMTKSVQGWFQSELHMRVLPTTSCSSALDMAAILSDIGPGDSFIVPSYTFVSSANAFVLRGATPIFADSASDRPHVGLEEIQSVHRPGVKVVVVVHYAGVSYDLPAIAAWCEQEGIMLVEDAAQSMGAWHGVDADRQHLGRFGALATFSFHETKNITSGEGGCLVVNQESLWGRACVIWEKGTNRQAFFRGEVDKYGWVDAGSSFLPNEITMAQLLGQLEHLESITSRRRHIWTRYFERFSNALSLANLPPDWRSETNGHLFYLCANSLEHRNEMLPSLKASGIACHFHYQSLHKSAYAQRMGWSAHAPNADRFTDCLFRLPLHLGLTDDDVDRVIENVLHVWH